MSVSAVQLTSAQAVATAAELDPLIRSAALRPDRENVLDPTVVDTIARRGLDGILVPAELGGSGLGIVDLMNVTERLAIADGSTAWVYMVHTAGSALAALYLEDDAVKTIFADGQLTTTAGVLAPLGTAVPTDGGYLLNGRYSFGSGISYSDWVMCGALVTVDGKPVVSESGEARHLALYTPWSSIEVLGNWDVLGLQATGSFDFSVTDAFVPSSFTFVMPEPTLLRGRPLFGAGVRALTAAGHAAVASGISTRALGEIAAIAATRRRPGAPSVSDQQTFKIDFAVHDAAVRSARSYVWDVCTTAENRAEAGDEVTEEQYQRIRQACTYLHRVAADAIRFAYQWSGTSGLRRPSAIGNCFVDISGATQHKYVDPNTLSDAAPEVIAAAARSAYLARDLP